MIPNLLPHGVKAAKWLVVFLVLTAYTVGMIWTYEAIDADPKKKAAPPDTITKHRTITERDTVTETVPETIIRYDTVETTDTLKIPVPSDTDFIGAVAPSPLDLTGEKATLTYFDGERWQQNVYDVPRDTWRIDLQAQGTALRDAAVASTSLQVRRRTALGWLGVGPAYSAVVTTEATMGLGLTVSLESTLWSN